MVRTLLYTALTALAVVGKAASVGGNVEEQPDTLQKRDDLAFDYEKDKMRGVTLGGWLVLEPYMTPSLFKAFGDDVPVDEYHYCQKLGKEECKSRLESHWNSFIVEDDIKQIKDLGLNTVRIPIGYWAFLLKDGDPYVQGQLPYVDRVLGWCRKHGLKAWVDLHGAPGSQNGFDNSGLRDSYDWQKDNNVELTLDALRQMSGRYGSGNWSDVVVGVEALNEPLAPILNMSQLKDFYWDSYRAIRYINGPAQGAVFHDGFKPAGYWNDFLKTDQNAWNVIIDHHNYQVFSPGQLNNTIEQHIQTACNLGLEYAKEAHWNVVGEWSAALTDCDYWVNGVGRGSRWEGQYDNGNYHGSCEPYRQVSSWSDEHKKNVRKFIEAQFDAYEQGSGWIFWSWKTEDAVDFDFQKLVYAGVVPQPLSERNYPNQCNY